MRLAAILPITAALVLRPQQRLRATTRRFAAEEHAAATIDGDVVILHRSRSPLAAVAYELAASLAARESGGVAVATDGDGPDAAAIKTLKNVALATPKTGATGYDDAMGALFKGMKGDRRVVVDLATRGAKAMDERLAAASSNKVDAFAFVSDLSQYEAQNTESITSEPLSGAEEALKKAAFPGGSLGLRCQCVLGTEGCDESFLARTHPLSYFFDRLRDGKPTPLPGPGPRSGGPPQLVTVSRAADVAALLEAGVADLTPKSHASVNAAAVNDWDLDAATYAQLARACGHAMGVEKLRAPLWDAASQDWGAKLKFPFAFPSYKLDGGATREAFEGRVRSPANEGRDAAVLASTPKKVYGAKRLKVDSPAQRRVQEEWVLFAAVEDAHAAWARAAAGAEQPDYTADEDLVRDGASLLGSLVYSATPFHERLGPPPVETD